MVRPPPARRPAPARLAQDRQRSDDRRQSARDAIAVVVQAGLIPIVEVDRSTPQGTQTVIRQVPAGGEGALPGDLVRLTVSIGTGSPPFVDLPMVVGALASQTQRRFAQKGVPVDVVQVQVPGHPYAGTGRVVAQYPVGRIPRSAVGRITLWIVTP